MRMKGEARIIGFQPMGLGWHRLEADDTVGRVLIPGELILFVVLRDYLESVIAEQLE